VIDTHCHLTAEAFAVDLPDVVRRSAEAGVSRLITIADSLAASEACLSLAEKYEHIFCTVGVHPHAASTWTVEVLGRVRALSSQRKVVAIGEIGLDFHYDFSPRQTQCDVFDAQLQLARERELPVVVHCREAIAEVRERLLTHEGRAVVHCCTEAWDDVAPLVAVGVHLSFTGIATFPKSTIIRDVIARCPWEQLMIETDSPYLAPVPHRGKRNEPSFLSEVLRCIAEMKGVSVAEAEQRTTQTALAFFGLPS
jgi:TatD DNase family protein